MGKYLNHLQYAARVILISSPGDETLSVLIILHNYSIKISFCEKYFLRPEIEHCEFSRDLKSANRSRRGSRVNTDRFRKRASKV